LVANIKIYPYRRNRTTSFNKEYIMNFHVPSIQSGQNTNIFTVTPYSHNDIQWLDIKYGLAGRQISTYQTGYSQTFLGTPPYKVEGGIVYLWHPYGWSGNVPIVGSLIQSHIHYKDNHRYLQYPYDVLDCETRLLDQEIIINFRLETDRIFDLESSYGEFTIHADTEVKTFFDTYWDTPDADNNYENVFGIELFLDGDSEAWMCSRKGDIIYDILEDNYNIKCYDWAKIQLSEIGDQWCPNMDYNYVDVPVTYFLDKVFDRFKGAGGVATVADLGDLIDTFSRTEYRGRRYSTPGFGYAWASPEMQMTVSQFIVEIQKHYAAFIYYDKNRILRIRRRDYLGESINIDDLVQEDTFEQIIRYKGNAGVIVNFNEDNPLPGDPYQGYYSIEADPTSSNGLKISGSLSEADVQARRGFLDIRQYLPFPTNATAVFEYRGIEKRYADYKELLIDLKQFRCTVNSLGIDLFSKVTYNGIEYRTVSVSKNYLKQESILEFVKPL